MYILNKIVAVASIRLFFFTDGILNFHNKYTTFNITANASQTSSPSKIADLAVSE